VSEDTIVVVGQSFALPHFEETFLETIRVASMSGEVFFVAKVAHNEFPVAFKLTECSSVLAAFENPAHDFPTGIVYNLLDDGSLRVIDRRIALTFDDAPRSDTTKFSGAERAAKLIENLAAANSPPVIFFSTARGINEEGDARMRAYQEAGHFIGNHTFSHQRISSMGVESYVADIERAHKILSQYKNFVPLFRYPFLDEGRDIESRDRLREAVESLGYQNGYVTIDNYDFHMDFLLQTALKQDREVNQDKLRDAYIGSLMESVRFGADIADRYLDHAPAHSLLLHENDLAAMFIGDLIKALRREGWTIIDARDAYKDPIAKVIPDTLFNNQGRVSAIARVKGAAPADLVHRAEDTDFLEQHFEESGAFGEVKSQNSDESE
jgi:peptidoglycan/xylan/chitin deacetylase (PgdA/CDA1 family)